MAILDIIIALLILASLIIGWSRGFIKELSALASWILALFLASLYYKNAATLVEQYLPVQPPISLVLGFIAVVVIVLVLAAIVSALLSAVIESVGIKSLDRTLGLVFGVIRGVVASAVAVFVINNVGMNTSAWYQESKLVVHLEPVSTAIYDMLPQRFTNSINNPKATNVIDSLEKVDKLKTIDSVENQEKVNMLLDLSDMALPEKVDN